MQIPSDRDESHTYDAAAARISSVPTAPGDMRARPSRQTELCAWLSAVVLVGLGLNAALGW